MVIRVLQKVNENPVFSDVSCSIGIQVCFPIGLCILLAFEAVKKQVAVLCFTEYPCCWMVKTSQFP